jgi:hypothetical protein
MAHKVPAEQRTSEQANLVLETAEKVKVSDKELIESLRDEERREHTRLREDVKKLPRPAPLPKAMALAPTDGASARAFILHRGEYTEPGDEVPAGFPEVVKLPFTHSLDRAGNDASISTTGAGSGTLPAQSRLSRAELANWVASRQNPLTSRVMVNRIWQHHFGRGLVPTPSDFGTHGQMPTHPELLEWLASEFCNRCLSIKHMHRLMLTSSTYRQVSVLDAGPMQLIADRERWTLGPKIDSENQFYWRMNRLRLEGEVIRDSLLAISGDLNSAMGGQGVFPPIPKELFAGSTGWSISPLAADHRRRSVYIFARRNLRFPFLEVFDAPDNNLSCPVREGSTTAPQSLTLLNADEVATAAKRLAIRIGTQTDSTENQLDLAFRLTIGRGPKPNELLLARQFLAESPFSEFCRALFNVNEFVYVE